MQVTFQKELKWNRAARGPRILVVFHFGKSEVEELGTRTISFPNQTISHAACGFVIVTGPAAIEINSDLSFWLCGNPLKQIASIGKCARYASNLAEILRPLPSEIERNNTAQ